MKTLKIIEKTKIWLGISLIVILAGIFCIFTKGLNYGIDFKGGTLVQINIKKDVNKEEVGKIIKKYTNDYTTNMATRSEEHTSELQSRQYLVCRLLLEKKKKRAGEVGR